MNTCFSLFFACKDTNIIFKSKKKCQFFAGIEKKYYLRRVNTLKYFVFGDKKHGN